MAERVGSFATTSNPLRRLYFYLNFPHRCFYQAHQVCALSAQTCAPCAFENAQVCDPTLSATKKEPLGLLFCGGESVSFACASRPVHTLFFIFTSFHTIAFVRLIRFASQTCAPCAFENAQVCDPTLSAKIKEARLGLFWSWFSR